jgi:hypothetical protein
MAKYVEEKWSPNYRRPRGDLRASSLENGFFKECHQQKSEETESFVILSRPRIHFDCLKWIKIDRDTAQYVVQKWSRTYRLQHGD